MDEFDSLYVSDLNYFLNETGIFNDIWKHHCYTRMFSWKHVMLRNSRGRDRMVLRFTIIKCLSALTLCVVSLNHAHGDVYSIQHCAIKFISDLRQVGGFLRFHLTNKTDCNDIAEILLKVALLWFPLTVYALICMWCSVFVGMVVQPQQWVAPVEAIPGCPPGLEYLTALDQILVKQQIELLESMG